MRRAFSARAGSAESSLELRQPFVGGELLEDAESGRRLMDGDEIAGLDVGF